MVKKDAYATKKKHGQTSRLPMPHSNMIYSKNRYFIEVSKYRLLGICPKSPLFPLPFQILIVFLQKFKT